MKHLFKRFLALACMLALLLSIAPLASVAAEDGSAEFVVLSTTDMHGRCWDTNILNDTKMSNSMLNVSTAVAQMRETYGDNVVLVDNGDTYQGTPVSTLQISDYTQGTTTDPNPMAISLKYIGYDLANLGNHEFNYAWSTMEDTYEYLANGTDALQGLPTICANLYYDGSDGVHTAGENVMTPYITKTVKDSAGNDVTIAIICFVTPDCTRWDVPDNYPGMRFSHPDNPSLSIAWEAEKYVALVEEQVNPDFVIVAFHSGLGSYTAQSDLEYGVSTENQVLSMITDTTGIDMVIAGHDHSEGYSNNTYPNKDGKEVLVVNGGGNSLTTSVFSIAADGAISLVSSVNNKLSNYAVDTSLKALIQPYADAASEYVNKKCGVIVGDWNVTNKFYLEQSDSMDLIGRTQIARGSYYLQQKYATAADTGVEGLDHLTVDVSTTSVVVNGNYNVSAGSMSMKDIYRLYRYDNSLYLITVTGAELKGILEFNAATHLAVNTSTGEAVFSTKGDDFTNPVFYGIDFKYDMSRAEYDRVVGLKFADGREVVDDEVYILAVNNYHLGNASGPFASYTTGDAIWSQTDDLGGGFVQDLIAEYLAQETAENGGVAPAPSNWEIVYTAEIVPEAVSGEYIASLVTDPNTLETGDQVVIYYNAGNTIITNQGSGSLNASEDLITGEGKLGTNDASAIFTVEKTETGAYRFVDADGKYMTSAPTGNGLNMEAAANECSDWEFEATEGGFYVHNLGANYDGNYNQYLEFYYSFTTYGLGGGGANYTFNFYKLPNTVAAYVPDPSELKDGDQVVFYYPNGSTAVTNAANGTKLAPTEDVFTTLDKLGTSEAGAVFTVKVAEDGGYAFVDAEGNYMTSGPTGNSLTMEAAANECSYWHFELTADGKGVYVFNNGANFNGNYNQALEFYGGGFTTYGHKSTAIYTFMVYKLVDPNCTHEHTVVRDAVEGYCATPGYTGDTYCADCYVFLSKGEATAAPGHNPEHTEIRDAVEAHCDVDGYTGDTYCTDCGEKVASGEVIPAPGHDPEKLEVRDTAEATCTAAGYTGDTYCTDCGNLVEAGTAIPAKGHSFGAWTCDGKAMYSHCDACDVYQVLPCSGEVFNDVDPAKWYHEAVDYVYMNGLMTGMNDGSFAPNGTMTRAQLVSVLYRLAGSPTVTADESFTFTDVKEGTWYYNAVVWAVQNNITAGKTAAVFAPNDTVTREQTAAFFYRYATLIGVAEKPTAELSFKDNAAISGYAKEAVAWCVENGIINGVGGNTMDPKGNCLRSHVATMLMKFCEEIG